MGLKWSRGHPGGSEVGRSPPGGPDAHMVGQKWDRGPPVVPEEGRRPPRWVGSEPEALSVGRK